jgi:hypothetical protein
MTSNHLFKQPVARSAAKARLLKVFPQLELDIDNFLQEGGHQLLELPAEQVNLLFATQMTLLATQEAALKSERNELRLSALEQYLAVNQIVPVVSAIEGKPNAHKP